MNKFQFAPADLEAISSLAAPIINNICIRSHNKRMKFCIFSGKKYANLLPQSWIFHLPLEIPQEMYLFPQHAVFVFPQAYFPDAHITLPDDQQGVHFLQTHRYFHQKSFYVILNSIFKSTIF